MPANDALLFIDANKYLDLYRIDKGKNLLAPLVEQMEYIFVTQQVVDEFQRNKVEVAAKFLSEKTKGLGLRTFNVPDHLSGTSSGQGDKILAQMREIVKNIKNVNEDVDALMDAILEQISRSEDEVSRALAPIFAKAVPHSSDELHRARERRELGNPPGQNTNTIGDQLTWEQILSHFKGKKRLWIISRDGDYGTVGKGLLNPFLLCELRKASSDTEIHLFEETVEGIKHFVDTTGVKSENRPPPEEMEEIKKEEKALPRFLKPSEQVRRMLAEANRPFEELGRWMAEVNKPFEVMRKKFVEAELRGEEMRRQMVADVNKPFDNLHRDLAGFNQRSAPIEELPMEQQRGTDEKPTPPQDDSSEKQESKEGEA